MKLRLIVLSGLLGVSLMMTSACSSDDVDEAINSIFNKNSVALTLLATQSHAIEFEDTSDGSRSLVSFCSDTNKRFLSDDENGTWVVNGNIVVIVFSTETIIVDTVNGMFEKGMTYDITNATTPEDSSVEKVLLISETVCPAAP